MNDAAVTVFVEIIDHAKLIAAGRQWLIDNGVAGDMVTAKEIIEDTDYAQALQYLIDPGVREDWGIQVDYSTVEFIA